MKKIIFLLALFILPIVDASLLITPNPVNLSLKVSETKSFTANFTNTFDFPIQDFSFTNFTDISFSQFTLQGNETKTINFSITKDTPIEQTFNTLVKFNYLVDIPAQPETHTINITATGYKPNFITIHEQDTVIWRNTDTISHSVTGSSFDLTIQPNQSQQRIFTEIGTFNYQDLILLFGGTIEVLNKSQAQSVHNPSYDTNWQIALEVIAEPTSITLENSDESNYTVPASGSTEGLLKVKNTGSNSAQTIHLSASRSWIIFEDNDFSLAPDEQKFISYRIEPFILETNETDKNYDIEIKAKALNTEELSLSINIFIPFQEIDLDPNNPSRLGDILTRFCREFPEACTPSTGGNGNVTVRDPEFTINITQSDWIAQRRLMQEMRDALERSGNRITTLEALLGTKLVDIDQRSNESLNYQIEERERNDRNWDVVWILGGILFIMGVVMYIFYKNNKLKIQKGIVDGGMGWKN